MISGMRNIAADIRAARSEKMGAGPKPENHDSAKLGNAFGRGLLEKEDGEVSEAGHAEEQIAHALRQAETGTPVTEVCRAMKISEQTHCRWKKSYGGQPPARLESR